jgi:nucleoporin SEH1
MDPNQPVQQAQLDAIKANLDAVTRQLARPAFLTNLTPSRLPSQAASDSSLSPTRDEARLHSGPLSHHRHSHLNLAITFEDVLEHADLVSPLIQEPCADGSPSVVDNRIVEQLELHFRGARYAYAKMAAERSFQTFSHGHQDLVLAVDFNYFGTRMVTASSDHRLKVWDKKDESWTLVESWRAHDAEITDVSALHPDLIFSRKPHSGPMRIIRHISGLMLMPDRSSGMAPSWEKFWVVSVRMAAARFGRKMSPKYPCRAIDSN